MLAYLPVMKASALDWFDKKTETKQSTENKVKSVRCDKCPSNCLIKPGEISPCGQYKNIDGKLVPIKK